MRVRVRMRMCVYTHVPICVYAYLHIDTHAYTHTHTHTNTRTHTHTTVCAVPLTCAARRVAGDAAAFVSKFGFIESHTNVATNLARGSPNLVQGARGFRSAPRTFLNCRQLSPLFPRKPLAPCTRFAPRTFTNMFTAGCEASGQVQVTSSALPLKCRLPG